MTALTKFLFPRDKPKSSVLFALAILAGYLVAGPIALFGFWLNLAYVANFGMALFALFLVLGFVMGFFHFTGRLTGRYRGITSRPWREQLW
jgi:hypothetical protein